MTQQTKQNIPDAPTWNLHGGTLVHCVLRHQMMVTWMAITNWKWKAHG
jgi:hypothetical protein